MELPKTVTTKIIEIIDIIRIIGEVDTIETIGIIETIEIIEIIGTIETIGIIETIEIEPDKNDMKIIIKILRITAINKDETLKVNKEEIKGIIIKVEKIKIILID